MTEGTKTMNAKRRQNRAKYPIPSPTPPGTFPTVPGGSRKIVRSRNIVAVCDNLRALGLLSGRIEKAPSVGGKRQRLRTFLDKIQAEVFAADKEVGEAFKVVKITQAKISAQDAAGEPGLIETLQNRLIAQTLDHERAKKDRDAIAHRLFRLRGILAPIL